MEICFIYIFCSMIFFVFIVLLFYDLVFINFFIVIGWKFIFVFNCIGFCFFLICLFINFLLLEFWWIWLNFFDRVIFCFWDGYWEILLVKVMIFWGMNIWGWGLLVVLFFEMFIFVIWLVFEVKNWGGSFEIFFRADFEVFFWSVIIFCDFCLLFFISWKLFSFIIMGCLLLFFIKWENWGCNLYIWIIVFFVGFLGLL